MELESTIGERIKQKQELEERRLEPWNKMERLLRTWSSNWPKTSSFLIYGHDTEGRFRQNFELEAPTESLGGDAEATLILEGTYTKKSKRALIEIKDTVHIRLQVTRNGILTDTYVGRLSKPDTSASADPEKEFMFYGFQRGIGQESEREDVTNFAFGLIREAYTLHVPPVTVNSSEPIQNGIRVPVPADISF